MRPTHIIKAIIESNPKAYAYAVKCWNAIWYNKTNSDTELLNALNKLGINKNEFCVCRACYGI